MAAKAFYANVTKQMGLRMTDMVVRDYSQYEASHGSCSNLTITHVRTDLFGTRVNMSVKVYRKGLISNETLILSGHTIIGWIGR